MERFVQLNGSGCTIVFFTMRARIALVMAIAAVSLAGLAAPASAGGSWLEMDRQAYRVGDRAAASGGFSTGQLGWVEDGPFFAFLRPAESDYGLVSADRTEIFARLRESVAAFITHLAVEIQDARAHSG